MAFNFMLPLRIAQALLAILVLGLTAYVASWYNTSTLVASPSQINFLIFSGSWTAAIAVPYLTLAPRYVPVAAHKFVILAAEVTTMIFWFAGFITLSVFLSSLVFCRGNVCNAARASAVFGAFEWLLFAATTVMASFHVFGSRQTPATSAPQMRQNGL